MLNRGSYNDLEPLTEKIPDNDIEINRVKAKAISMKMKLFQDIIQFYDSEKIFISFYLSQLVDTVFQFDFDKDGNIRHILRLEIKSILDTLDLCHDFPEHCSYRMFVTFFE
ncbi:hypothetical protein RF11_16394 [Thelohanellus kitauei]|uniref:Uncharacterized protein n=1 Tax=Thelohanellus kitauei TaxID=669202 RepID=A0A0C2IE73_THEKT|nr:hypothetical protein RF11_16394 [Thelohanellus kitauei]